MVMIEVENWSDKKFWIITTNYVEREYLYILLVRCLVYWQTLQQQQQNFGPKTLPKGLC